MRYTDGTVEVDNLLVAGSTCLTWDRIAGLDLKLLPCRVSSRCLNRDSFGCSHLRLGPCSFGFRSTSLHLRTGYPKSGTKTVVTWGCYY